MSERPPLVNFETRAIPCRSRIDETGRISYRNVDFVMVTTEGGKNVFEDEAVNWLNRQREMVANGRVDPRHLDYFERNFEQFKKGQEMTLDGTDIKMWPLISPAQIKMCQSANLFTVEALANATEEGLYRVGMGARELKAMAKNWLDSGEQGKVSTKLTELQDRLDAALDLIQQQKAEIDRLRTESGDDKPRRGRPAKEDA